MKVKRLFAHRNAECVKCEVILRDMVRIGAIIMCPSCFEEEFSTDDPVREERPKYFHWLHKWVEKEE